MKTRKKIIESILLEVLLLGQYALELDFFIGREHEIIFWTKIFKEAHDNESVKLLHNSIDGQHYREYILKYVGEVSH